MALDIEQPEALIAYLRSNGHLERTELPAVQVLGGGVSNRTVLVQWPGGKGWVLKQALSKLRVESDWFSDPLRIEREAVAMRWLSRLAPAGAITPLYFCDPANHVLAMQAVPPPHENWKSMLLAGRLERRHVEAFGRILGQVHRLASEMRDELEAAFGDRSFFESLRLEPYYAYTAGQVPPAGEFLTRLIDETRRRRDTLVHGDYSPKNVLIHNDRLVLLDHEVVHWGDAAFDLGFSITHLLSKALHLPEHRGDFAAAARRYWEVYRETIGDVVWSGALEPRVVRHTLACLLARVAGRSPLEYLSSDDRERQKGAVLRLLSHLPGSVEALIDQFVLELEPHAENPRA